MAMTNDDYVDALRTVMAATLRPIAEFAHSGGPRYVRDPEHMFSYYNLLSPTCGGWAAFTNVREEYYISPVGDGSFTDEVVMRMDATCQCGEYRNQDAVTELRIQGYGEVEQAMRFAEKAVL